MGARTLPEIPAEFLGAVIGLLKFVLILPVRVERLGQRALIRARLVLLNHFHAGRHQTHRLPRVRRVTLHVVVFSLIGKSFALGAGRPNLHVVAGHAEQRIMVKTEHARKLVHGHANHKVIQRDAHAGRRDRAPLAGQCGVKRPPRAAVDLLAAAGLLKVFLVYVVNALTRRLRDVVVVGSAAYVQHAWGCAEDITFVVVVVRHYDHRRARGVCRNLTGAHADAAAVCTGRGDDWRGPLFDMDAVAVSHRGAVHNEADDQSAAFNKTGTVPS